MSSREKRHRCKKHHKKQRKCIKHLTACDIRTKSLITDTISANDLSVSTINGKDPNCSVTSVNFPSNITQIEYIDGIPQQPANDGRYNQVVLNRLWEETLFYQKVVQDDINCGRLRERMILDFYKCQVCPPVSECTITGGATIVGSINNNVLTITDIISGNVSLGQVLVGPKIKQETTIIMEIVKNITYKINIEQTLAEETILLVPNCPESPCILVPLKIYGIQTVPPGIWDPLCKQNNIAASIAYNLDVINRSIDLSTKVVSVIVQVGWIDPTSQTPDKFATRQIDLSNRQFGASLAVVFGEKFSSNILLSTLLMEEIVIAMPPFVDTNNAAVQVVVYTEEGIEVFVPPQPRSIPDVGNTTDNTDIALTSRTIPTNHNGNVSVSFVGSDCPNCVTLTENTENPWPIPSGVKCINLGGFGAGGGGGISGTKDSLITDSGRLPGGGGGSGFFRGTPAIDLSQHPTARFVKYEIGKGGDPFQNGFPTKFSIVDANQNPLLNLSWQANGGNAGGTVQDLVAIVKSGNGGSGYYGGGGGGRGPNVGPFPSQTGDGGGGQAINGSGQNGFNNGVNDVGGSGGGHFLVNNSLKYFGAPGGSYSGTPRAFGGGGGGGGQGGGSGGGNGHTNGFDATPASSGGGGGAAAMEDALPGKGGSGYIELSYVL